MAEYQGVIGSLRSGRLPRCVLPVLLVVWTFAATSAGQNVVVDDEIAPPPLRLITEDERKKLEAENNIKRRTKLGLELMDARLKQAETFDTAEDHDRMFVELGGFHGLMDNMLDFLNKSDKDDGKVLNNFKRFEIGLRGFTPRLELIRRDLPIKYEQYVRILIRNLRTARTKAIEPLFDDSVVPVKKPV